MSDTQGIWGAETRHFHLLTPDHVMAAAEMRGKRLTGRVMALNSLENRVYDVELAASEDFGKGFAPQNVILKFYRPGRWSEAQILEEHSFLNTLIEFEVPVVAPLEFNGKTLHLHQETNLWFTLFPKVMGRLKDELIKDEIDQVGRLIGRIHNIGSMGNFTHRLALSPTTFITRNMEALLQTNPVEHISFQHYLKLLEQLRPLLDPMFNHLPVQKLHGDFHRGNIVWTSAGPMAVDFDDCLTGPIEQDLWLLFPGQDPEGLKEKERFLDAYKEMTRKTQVRANLTEPLRTMRMVHFNAWIAKRWEDHSFQRIFPQFPSPSYWDQQLIDLRVQMGLIQDLAGMGFEH
ncbi:MAG TPA: serine/threonine protein kinase [Bacteriovoracaceae bacterium]|nr:serine/threonine protein kinase [Bacteriovoracaceae bacterium]